MMGEGGEEGGVDAGERCGERGEEGGAVGFCGFCWGGWWLVRVLEWMGLDACRVGWSSTFEFDGERVIRLLLSCCRAEFCSCGEGGFLCCDSAVIAKVGGLLLFVDLGDGLLE